MEDRCQVPFAKVVQFLETLADVKKHKQKRQMLLDFFERSNVQSFFPIVRLMLPGFDRERENYGMKETTLGRRYAEILSLPPREKDALVHYKNPRKALPGCSANNFADILAFILRNRTGDRSTLTVEDVNRELDQLAIALSKEDKRLVLSRLLQNMTALEQKWLAKIIVKDLKMGYNERILKCFHPKALELFYSCNSLRQVFVKIKDKNTELDTQLFMLHHPIRPMLAGRKVYSELKKLLVSLEVLVETKFDGERIQCHFSTDGEVNFFTRNANDYTYLYGPKMRDFMLQAVRNVHSCILDGEMIVWDKTQDRPAQFGQNKPVALTEVEGEQHLKYMVFDVLYIKTKEGEEFDLMKKPLTERKQMLDHCVDNIRTRVEKVPGKRVTGTKAVLDEFALAVERDEEGIVVKQLASQYIPDDRSTLWMKLKTDYMEGIGDSLDVLVVGGYFGSERRVAAGDDINHITVFLMAVAHTVDLKDPRKSRFVPFCRVGTGYSMEELQMLRDRLRNCMRPFSASALPDYWPKWTPGASERPDYIVTDPSKSVILELRGAELVKTEKFPVGLCLRFPKVNRVRLDKSWDQCMTVAEIQGLTQSLVQGERPERAEDKAEARAPEKKRRVTARKTGEVVSIFKDTDTSGVQTLSQLFVGHEFYFMTLKGFEKSKEDMERLVVQHGGSKTQNFMRSTTDVIVSDETVLRVRNFIQFHPDLDIVRPEWILDCVARAEVLDLRPKYVVHASPRTQLFFSSSFSRYGDPYFVNYRDAAELLATAKSIPMVEVYEMQRKLTGNWLDTLAPPGFKEAWNSATVRRLQALNCYVHGTGTLLEDKLWRGLVETRLRLVGATVEPSLCQTTTLIVLLPGAAALSQIPPAVGVVDVDWVLEATKLDSKSF